MARCISPILAKGSTRREPVWVPCSRCGYCLQKKQLSWTFRLTEEMEQSLWPTMFVTLTYNDDNLPYTLDDYPLIKKHYGDLLDEKTLLTKDVQDWMKRLRKEQRKHTSAQIRYYAAGEYGARYGRPHYHYILFNLHPKTLLHLAALWSNRGRNGKSNPKPMGIIDIRPCDGSRAVFNYVSGYIINAIDHVSRVNKRPFSIMSKRPYLGHTYVTRMKEYHKRLLQPYLERGKLKIALPQIFKEKIFEQWELNSMKQPLHEAMENKLAADLHEQYLLNGPDWDGFSYLEHQRIYNEQLIIKNGKHNDYYEYKLGPGRKATLFN